MVLLLLLSFIFPNQGYALSDSEWLDVEEQGKKSIEKVFELAWERASKKVINVSWRDSNLPSDYRLRAPFLDWWRTGIAPEDPELQKHIVESVGGVYLKELGRAFEGILRPGRDSNSAKGSENLGRTGSFYFKSKVDIRGVTLEKVSPYVAIEQSGGTRRSSDPLDGKIRLNSSYRIRVGEIRQEGVTLLPRATFSLRGRSETFNSEFCLNATQAGIGCSVGFEFKFASGRSNRAKQSKKPLKIESGN